MEETLRTLFPTEVLSFKASINSLINKAPRFDHVRDLDYVHRGIHFFNDETRGCSDCDMPN